MRTGMWTKSISCWGCGTFLFGRLCPKHTPKEPGLTSSSRQYQGSQGLPRCRSPHGHRGHRASYWWLMTRQGTSRGASCTVHYSWPSRTSHLAHSWNFTVMSKIMSSRLRWIFLRFWSIEYNDPLSWTYNLLEVNYLTIYSDKAWTVSSVAQWLLCG